VVNPNESAQIVAIINSDDDSSQRLSLYDLANYNAKDCLRGVHTITTWAFLILLLDKFLQISVDSADDYRVVIENLGNGLVAAVVVVCNF